MINLLPWKFGILYSYAIKSYPLDLVQFSRMYATTRIPYLNKDKLVVYNDSTHIIIMKGC